MSAKAIYEGKGKELLNQFLTGEAVKNRFAIVEENVNWNQLVQDHPWLNSQVGRLCFFLLQVILKLINLVLEEAGAKVATKPYLE